MRDAVTAWQIGTRRQTRPSGTHVAKYAGSVRTKSGSRACLTARPYARSVAGITSVVPVRNKYYDRKSYRSPRNFYRSTCKIEVRATFGVVAARQVGARREARPPGAYVATYAGPMRTKSDSRACLTALPYVRSVAGITSVVLVRTGIAPIHISARAAFPSTRRPMPGCPEAALKTLSGRNSAVGHGHVAALS